MTKNSRPPNYCLLVCADLRFSCFFAVIYDDGVIILWLPGYEGVSGWFRVEELELTHCDLVVVCSHNDKVHVAILVVSIQPCPFLL